VDGSSAVSMSSGKDVLVFEEMQRRLFLVCSSRTGVSSSLLADRIVPRYRPEDVYIATKWTIYFRL